MTAQKIIEDIQLIVTEMETWRDRANYWETMSRHHEAERVRLEMELDKYKWRPIETFDSRMFSIMTAGIPDSCEVVKYKGDIPDWAAMWTAVPPIPRAVEESDGT